MDHDDGTGRMMKIVAIVFLAAAVLGLLLLGITGLAIAGTEFAQAVKDRGWKGAPAVAWRALVHGKGIQAAE